MQLKTIKDDFLYVRPNWPKIVTKHAKRTVSFRKKITKHAKMLVSLLSEISRNNKFVSRNTKLVSFRVSRNTKRN
jgi:hypothetical protein